MVGWSLLVCHLLLLCTCEQLQISPGSPFSAVLLMGHAGHGGSWPGGPSDPFIPRSPGTPLRPFRPMSPITPAGPCGPGSPSSPWVTGGGRLSSALNGIEIKTQTQTSGKNGYLFYQLHWACTITQAAKTMDCPVSLEPSPIFSSDFSQMKVGIRIGTGDKAMYIYIYVLSAWQPNSSPCLANMHTSCMTVTLTVSPLSPRGPLGP